MVGESDGSEYVTRATYLEVVEPELLVWKVVDSGMTVRITFTVADENRTEVRVCQSDAPEAFRSARREPDF